MTSATTVPPSTTEARAEAFMYVIHKGWLTGRQMKEATEFGKAATKDAKR